MSKKGQLVVPKDILEDEHFEPSDKFIAITIKDGVIFKKGVKKRFEEEEISEDEVDELRTASISSLFRISSIRSQESLIPAYLELFFNS